MGSSYCLPVRLSVTDRVLFDTRIVLENGWGKITRGRPLPPSTVLYNFRDDARASVGQARRSQTGSALPDPLRRRRPAGPASGGPRLPRVPLTRYHTRGCRDRRQRIQGDGGDLD